MDGAFVERLRQKITAIAQGRPDGLGAELGQILQSGEERTAFKNTFGSIKSFIQAHASDLVAIDGRSGMDYKWRSLVFTELIPGPQKRAGGEELWEAFARSSSPKKLYLDPGGKALIVSIDPLDDLTQIPAVTREEHKDIARDFVRSLDLPDSELLSSILDREPYWTEWIQALARRPELNRKWSVHRLGRLKLALKNRLDAAGVGDETSHLLAESLSHSNARRIANTKTDRGQKARGVSAAPGQARSPERIRAALLAVIGKLSEAELRQIWVPLSAVADYWQDHNSR